jgi:hypothetical protein
MFSQNGYKAKDFSLIASYTVPDTDVRVSLRKGDVSVVLLYLLKQFNATVEPVRQKDTGGYNPRSIISSTVLSNHASGTAVDINWQDHVMGSVNTFTPKQEFAIYRILAFLEGTVRWGGNYSGRKDEMHFEINAPLSKVTDVAEKIRNGGVKPVVVKPVGKATVVLKQGSRGPLIKHLQGRLNDIFPSYSRLKEDGIFGPKLEAVIREFQRRTNLTPDGEIGPKTRAMLKRFGITL